MPKPNEKETTNPKCWILSLSYEYFQGVESQDSKFIFGVPKVIHPDKERALQRSERDPLLRFWNLPGLESFLCLEYSQLKRQIYYY